MSIVPKSRPQITVDRVRAILAKAGVADKVALVGIRGYYEDSMGKPDQNDRGIYDDAMIIVAPDGIWTFNANTDPSHFRTGVSVLDVGVHPYHKGIHPISRPGGYPALRPATPGEKLPVTRDGKGHSMGVAINIHKGSHNSTSSEGCQTIYPDQWDQFIQKAYGLMDRYSQKVVRYVLIAQ